MSNEIKNNKGAVVKEINGVKYFKLRSPYAGDYTKNCGLLANEIDENFFFLRSYDIQSMKVDEDRNLILTRVDGDKLVVNISEEVGYPTFEFIKEEGKIIVHYPDGTTDVMEGFLIEGQDIKVATDFTIKGDGRTANPLRISEVERTGTYAPAQTFLDMAVFDYYVKECTMIGEDDKVYHYEPIAKSDIPEGEAVIMIPELPKEEDVNFRSPKYVKVQRNIPMPNGDELGKGYRLVTKEFLTPFGCLYDYYGVTKIQEALNETGSAWRVPSRKDWAALLNAAEYCESGRNHDTLVINEWTGIHAGARAKSVSSWKWCKTKEDGWPVQGIDNLPSTGSYGTFHVIPIGYGEGSRGPMGKDIDFDIEGLKLLASFWTMSPTNSKLKSENPNIYTRTFAYDTRKVLQESSKPSSRLSLRLVKDFDFDSFNQYENILGHNVPCVLVSNPETNYSKIWTSVNIGFTEPQYSGVTSSDWCELINTEDREVKEVYYINEWNGVEWVKKPMNPGDSVVILDFDGDPSTSGDTYHEWRVYEHEDGTVELIDTAEALKEEFQKEIDEINEKIDELSGITEEIREDLDNEIARAQSAETMLAETIEEVDKKVDDEIARAQSAETMLQEAIDAETERALSAETVLQGEIDDLSGFTQTMEENVNDLANEIIGVSGSVEDGFIKPDFYGSNWQPSSEEEWNAHPDDRAELQGFAPEDLPDAREWHEAGNPNYLEMYEDDPEQHPHHVATYWKLVSETNYISDADNLVEAILDLDEAVKESIDSIQIQEVTPADPDETLRSYALFVNGEERPIRIEVPKDDVQIFHEILLGCEGATINEDTGEITDGPKKPDGSCVGHDMLLLSYENSEGKYKLLQLDIENIIIENEFGDGLKVEDNIVSVLIDPESDTFLTVGPDGILLSGVTSEIARLDQRIDDEIERATSAETILQEEIDAEIERAISAETVLQEEIDAETERAISAETVLQEEIDAEIERAISAETVLQEEIDAEVERAKAAEESISGDVTTLSGQVEEFSASTVEEIARLDGKDIAPDGHQLSVTEGLTLVRENSDEIKVNIDTNFGLLPNYE